MGIDRETVVDFSCYIDYNKSMLKRFEENNKKISGAEDHKEHPQLVITTPEDGILQVEEYYFDEQDTKLVFSGNLENGDGKIFVSVYLPLSDIVLIDILQHSIRKLNKLKTALESLK